MDNSKSSTEYKVTTIYYKLRDLAIEGKGLRMAKKRSWCKYILISFNVELVPESFNSPKGIIVNSPVATLHVNPGLHKQK